MPKFNFGLDVTDVDAAEGFGDYEGPLPPNGAYDGRLKVVKIAKIKSEKNAGKLRLQIGVEITHPDFKGYFAWGGVNLTDQGAPFVNQFLRAITDGSDSEFNAIRKAFSSSAGVVVDEKKENVLKIGKWKIDSPQGELPIKVQLKQRTWDGVTRAGVQTFLLREDGALSDDDSVVEEGEIAEGVEEPEEAEDDSGMEDAEQVDESIFDAEEETADA